MTATHWIAIAAIITPLINTWIQFWLKERSEKKKTLAAANPPISQRKVIKGEGTSKYGILKRVLAEQWRINLVLYLANWPLVSLILFIMNGALRPASRVTSVMIIGMCAISLAVINILPWGRNWK